MNQVISFCCVKSVNQFIFYPSEFLLRGFTAQQTLLKNSDKHQSTQRFINHEILSKDWECIIDFVQEITCWALQRQPTRHPEQSTSLIIRNKESVGWC